MMTQISPVQTSTMNWYMVLSFHGSICESYCGRNNSYCYLDEANHLQCYDGRLPVRIRYKLQGDIICPCQ
ncbi:hypothetical protein CFP56_031298 [Quercus suber]|uniref:Uncharacterized protein n=1 Tax=Quercus suber TaxID=58331 RepID=A0AAW0JJR1_QUESU